MRCSVGQLDHTPSEPRFYSKCEIYLLVDNPFRNNPIPSLKLSNILPLHYGEHQYVDCILHQITATPCKRLIYASVVGECIGESEVGIVGS